MLKISQKCSIMKLGFCSEKLRLSNKGVGRLKDRDIKLARLKRELYLEREKGKKEVVRKLNKTEAEYLSKFFTLVPYLYEIKVQFAPNFNPKAPNVPGVVKGIFYDFRRKHKYTIIKKLTVKEFGQCEAFGLRVWPYKYKVKLKG